ncbi:MAG: hypothetical protein GY720_02515 [bacterium]|nr:hypothetical protein [bacterium]
MILALILAAAILGASRAAVQRVVGWLGLGRPDPIDPAEYFDTVGRELRRGSSLRHALAIPVPGSRLARLALTGQPIELVSSEVVTMLSLSDDLPAAGIRLASRTGAPSSKVFGRLAEQARAAKQHQRDRGAATAQARLSAAVVGLVPPGLGMAILTAGGGRHLAQPGPARTAVVFGAGLQLLGLVVIAVLLRLER